MLRASSIATQWVWCGNKGNMTFMMHDQGSGNLCELRVVLQVKGNARVSSG